MVSICNMSCIVNNFFIIRLFADIRFRVLNFVQTHIHKVENEFFSLIIYTWLSANIFDYVHRIIISVFRNYMYRQWHLDYFIVCNENAYKKIEFFLINKTHLSTYQCLLYCLRVFSGKNDSMNFFLLIQKCFIQ